MNEYLKHLKHLKHLDKVERFARANSPHILTGMGVAGTLMTAILASKASFKAADIIRDEQFKQNVNDEKRPLTNSEKVALTWKQYIPAATTGAVTVSCIIMANQIGTRRAAAIAAAFALSEKGFDEYKSKVAEKFGETKAREVHDELFEDRVRAYPPHTSSVYRAKGGDTLCMEGYTGRYFTSDMETIRQAVNEVNFRILHEDFASLSNFYDLMDLEHTSNSDNIGWWTFDRKMEVDYTTVLTPDGKPCLCIEYTTIPVPSKFEVY